MPGASSRPHKRPVQHYDSDEKSASSSEPESDYGIQPTGAQRNKGHPSSTDPTDQVNELQRLLKESELRLQQVEKTQKELAAKVAEQSRDVQTESRSRNRQKREAKKSSTRTKPNSSSSSKHRMAQQQHARPASSSSHSPSPPPPPSCRTTRMKHSPNADSLITPKIEDQIRLYARKFFVMNEITICSDAFAPLPSNPDEIIEVDAIDRYLDEESALQGLISELHAVVPKELHELMEKYSGFADEFLHAHGNIRRSIIHQLRAETAGGIFEKPQRFYHYDYDWQNNTEFAMLLRPFPKDMPRFRKTGVLLYPPILFKEKKRNMKDFLFAPEVPWVLRTILFGPSSLTKKKPSKHSNAYKWSLKGVTPGAIALAAVLTIFLHSTDRHFEAVGGISGFQYAQMHSRFKQLINQGLDKNPDHFKKLVKFFNDQVFIYGSASSLKAGNDLLDDSDGDVDFSDGIDEAINAIGEDNQDQDEDNDDDDGGWSRGDLSIIKHGDNDEAIDANECSESDAEAPADTPMEDANANLVSLIILYSSLFSITNINT
ncbi:hypothetical protein BJ165DRAFT_365970 [Panaeolus papilionaceus]|nr:hypothetical protein BJ165DRAFT_365970 [Panaeolus papilionaceus]